MTTCHMIKSSIQGKCNYQINIYIVFFTKPKSHCLFFCFIHHALSPLLLYKIQIHKKTISLSYQFIPFLDSQKSGSAVFLEASSAAREIRCKMLCDPYLQSYSLITTNSDFFIWYLFLSLRIIAKLRRIKSNFFRNCK